MVRTKMISPQNTTSHRTNLLFICLFPFQQIKKQRKIFHQNNTCPIFKPLQYPNSKLASKQMAKNISLNPEEPNLISTTSPLLCCSLPLLSFLAAHIPPHSLLHHLLPTMSSLMSLSTYHITFHFFDGEKQISQSYKFSLIVADNVAATMYIGDGWWHHATPQREEKNGKTAGRVRNQKVLDSN